MSSGRPTCHARRMSDSVPDQAPPPFEHVPEDWQRALCVVAHPDDMEFGAAAAVARWTGQGKDVVYCMVTSGEAGIDGMHPSECEGGPRGRADRVRADRGGRRGGVPRAARRDPRVRRRRCDVPSPPPYAGTGPTMVITNNFRDSWGGRNLNQADHIATGRPRWTRSATRGTGGSSTSRSRTASNRGAGCRRCGRRPPPTPATRSTSPPPSTRAWSRLSAHRAYIDGLGWEDFDPAEFLEGMSRASGSRLGVAHAAPFEVFSMGWGD